MVFPRSANQVLRKEKKKKGSFLEFETHNCLKSQQIPQYMYTLNVGLFCRRESEEYQSAVAL